MDTFLAYWAEDGDDSLDTFETEQEAVDCLEEWIERRRDDAADEGWPTGMHGYVAKLTHRVQEYETKAPEGSSFETCCDYAVKSLPDDQAARIAALEGEVAALKGRLRETCQILVESVGGLGPCNAEDAARRAAQVVDQLRAQLAAPCEPSPWKRLGFVHDGIRVTSVAAARDEDGMGVVALWDLGRDGVWRLCGWGCTEDHEGPDDGEEPLPETPPACLLTIPGKTPEPAPLRLGRGPTDEEFRRHNTTGGGWLLQGVGEDMGGWTMEMRPIPEADIPAMVRFTRDAIPLNASRQPCGVGVKV